MHFFTIASVFYAAALGVFASPVAERGTPPSVAVILTDLSDIITPLTNQLLYATPQNATEAIVTPIIGDINTAVTNAIANLNGLIDQPANVIMASIDGTTTLTASDIATLLAPIANSIFMSLNAILGMVESAVHTIIYNLSQALGQVKVVFSLMTIPLHLIPGLLSLLLTLIKPFIPLIIKLGLGAIFQKIFGGSS